MTNKVVPIQRQSADVLEEVGGPIDETGVKLCVYGEDLDPDDVSKRLGIEPTDCHRIGERKSPRSPPWDSGAWILEIRGEPPDDPETLTSKLLSKLTVDGSVWMRLSDDYIVQLRYGIHMKGWNREFDFSSELVSKIATTNAQVVFDIYANSEDDF